MLHWIFPEPIVYLYFSTLSIILIVGYRRGYSTSFLRAVTSILYCAFDVIFGKIFLGWISRVRDWIFIHIRVPTRRFFDRIPRPVKALFYMLVGAGILYLDHKYNTKIFAEDETNFYDIVIFGKKYWFTEVAILYGGGILAYGILKLFFIISGSILSLLDKRIRVSLVLRQ